VKILQQKVKELTLDLANFVNGTENLRRLMGTSRHPSDKSRLGYQNDEEHTSKVKLFSKCFIYSKYRHLRNRYYHKKHKLQASDTNKNRPKKIWVPRDLIVPGTYIFNREKTNPETIYRQWLHTSHDGQNVNIARSSAM